MPFFSIAQMALSACSHFNVLSNIMLLSQGSMLDSRSFCLPGGLEWVGRVQTFLDQLLAQNLWKGGFLSVPAMVAMSLEAAKEFLISKFPCLATEAERLGD